MALQRLKTLLSVIARPLRGPAKLLALLRSKSIWIVLYLVVVIIPSYMGVHAMLRSIGTPWYIAPFAAGGYEFGGMFTTIYYNVEYLTNNPSLFGMVAVGIGTLAEIARLFWTYLVYKKWKRFQDQNISQRTIMQGFIILLVMLTVIALMTDQFVLPDDTTRMSGMTYLLENPNDTLEPLTDAAGLLVEQGAEAGVVNESQVPENLTDPDLPSVNVSEYKDRIPEG